MAVKRTVREIIDEVIRENRPAEFFCYVLVLIFAAVGVGVVIRGALMGEGGVALAGAVAAALFWPALHNARQIRKENMAVRLLEAALNKAQTSEAASHALHEAFTAIFVKSSQIGR